MNIPGTLLESVCHVLAVRSPCAFFVGKPSRCWLPVVPRRHGVRNGLVRVQPLEVSGGKRKGDAMHTLLYILHKIFQSFRLAFIQRVPPFASVGPRAAAEEIIPMRMFDADVLSSCCFENTLLCCNSRPRTKRVHIRRITNPHLPDDLDISGQINSRSALSSSCYRVGAVHSARSSTCVGSVLYRSCTTSHNGKLGSK